MFGERTTWKMLDLCQALGVRFDPPCERAEIEGLSGQAEFTTTEHEGFIELKVVRYLHRAG